MQPVAMRKTMARIVSHNRGPFLAGPKAALQLHNEFENLPAFHLEPYAQAVAWVQQALKLHCAHKQILPV